MGKKGGTSWLTAVKRVFRSSSKDNPDKVKNFTTKEDHHHQQQQLHNDCVPSQDLNDDQKKKEKKRWLFKKSVVIHQEGKSEHQKICGNAVSAGGSDIAEHRHAIALAVAKAAAAEAALATANAAMEMARLSKPGITNSNVSHKLQLSAVVIQTSFRGYLARRALRALKGLVKLQALVRGHNVRKQAKMTLKCMQALVRVQAKVLDQRMRLSHEGCRKSTFSDTASISESRYLKDIAERRSISHSREPSSIPDDWDERPHTIEEVKAMLQSKIGASFKHEKTLSRSFSRQMRRSDKSSMGVSEELEEKPRRSNRWITTKQWESAKASSPVIRHRVSIDHHQRESIKTVEMDTSQPNSYLPSNLRRCSTSSSSNYQPNYHNQRPPSPIHSKTNLGPSTPSPAQTRPIQVRSASPRSIRDGNVSQTPSLMSNYSYNANLPPHNGSSASRPNYMAATESAKARVRSYSAPRQRASTPERDRPGTGGGPKKRLSFPNPDPYGGPNLRSPSFKSVMEQQSNYSSCCTESIGGEISPCSTTDLRRWLR